jgi:multiple sugar transport system substrate-binding protein
MHKDALNRRRISIGAALVAMSLFATACGGAPTPAPAAPTPAPAATEAPKVDAPAAPTEAPAAPSEAPPAPTEAPAGGGEVITWYQYDEKNEDPKNDEAVGNAYIRDTIKVFNEEMAGKLTWVNQPQPFNKMSTALVAAVQAGGEVPDVMQAGSDALPTFLKNDTVQDLTDWAKAQSWYADLDPNAIAACTGPDGKLYCVPASLTSFAVYYWKEHFPNGYPKTPEEFLTQAEALKAKNIYAITFFGNGSAFDGDATSRFFFSTFSSFGGGYDDGKGGMLLNTPENVKAVEFMRTVVSKGYASEDIFLGDFKEENKFKTSEAASFPTGVFVYRYLQPLKSPGGKDFGKDFDPTGKPMKDAVADGAMGVAPMFAPDGKKAGCNSSVGGFVIPKGAKNLEGAHMYINWVMSEKQYSGWVKTVGGGAPAAKIGYKDPEFGIPYYTETAKASEGLCRPWAGSLKDPTAAKKIIAATIFDLIKGKEAGNADIAAVLTKAQDEYNAANK